MPLPSVTGARYLSEMTVFVVISKLPNPALERAVIASYPEANHRFSDRVWLISSRQTVRQISDKLGVKKGGEIKGTVVLATSGAYYGVASPAVWDWLRSAGESGDE